MEKTHESVRRFLDKSFLALVKIGVVGALIPVIFVLLRAPDHFGYVQADAEIVRSYVQCEISESAAARIGERARWWDCKAAADLRAAHPGVNLRITSTEFADYRFSLPNGQVQNVSAPTTFFDMGRPQPGRIVPILYSPTNPGQVKMDLLPKHWVFLGFFGLIGMATGMLGWQLRENQSDIAGRVTNWLQKVQKQNRFAAGPAPEPVAAVPAKSPAPGPLRSDGRRTLGIG